jgi:hypothetical protein
MAGAYLRRRELRPVTCMMMARRRAKATRAFGIPRIEIKTSDFFRYYSGAFWRILGIALRGSLQATE